MDWAAVAIWAAVPFTVETSENTLTLAFAACAWASVELNSDAYTPPVTVVFDSSWSWKMSPAAAAAPAMLTRANHAFADSPARRGRTEPVTVARSRAGAWRTFRPLA